MRGWLQTGLIARGAIARALGAAMLCAAVARGADDGRPTGTQQSTRLYTAPDPAAGGGIHGALAKAHGPIVRILAVDADDYRRVFEGRILAPRRDEFRFDGLPPGRYDLVVLFADRFYEGLTLERHGDTLTPADRAAIEAAVRKSSPFFDTKAIHRCAGITGREGKARCVLQEVRTRPVTLQSAEVRTDIQVRSLKLALLEDVGAAGWALEETRELVRQEVLPGDARGTIGHRYCRALSGIRVVESVKELGQFPLDAAGGPVGARGGGK